MNYYQRVVYAGVLHVAVVLYNVASHYKKSHYSVETTETLKCAAYRALNASFIQQAAVSLASTC